MRKIPSDQPWEWELLKVCVRAPRVVVPPRVSASRRRVLLFWLLFIVWCVVWQIRVGGDK